MSNIKKSTSELVGNTPLLELTGIEKKYGLKTRILVKMEMFNPSGSIKDRIAYAIIKDAEDCGKLKPGGTIVEATSGNTGIGLCAMGCHMGYRVIIVMPENMSEERKKIIRAYGGELVLTSAEGSVPEAIAKAEELAKTIPGAILAGQFVNDANPQAHYENTGREIWEDADGEIDYFISGIGTGGTLTGIGTYLKAQKPAIKVVAMEPENAALLLNGGSGAHVIEGIGDGVMPDVLNKDVVDEIITVSDREALETDRELVATEGIFSGISTGAALFAALKIAERPEAAGKTIVIIAADSADRYLSTRLFA